MKGRRFRRCSGRRSPRGTRSSCAPLTGPVVGSGRSCRAGPRPGLGGGARGRPGGLWLKPRGSSLESPSMSHKPLPVSYMVLLIFGPVVDFVTGSGGWSRIPHERSTRGARGARRGEGAPWTSRRGRRLAGLASAPEAGGGAVWSARPGRRGTRAPKSADGGPTGGGWSCAGSVRLTAHTPPAHSVSRPLVSREPVRYPTSAYSFSGLRSIST